MRQDCLNCNHGKAEDEVYFWLSCPVNDETTALMKVINEINSSIGKTQALDTFNNILSSEYIRIIFSLGTVLQKCLKRYNHLLIRNHLHVYDD